MIIKAVKFNKEVFNVEVNDNNFYDIKIGLELERIKFINKLKEYKNAGLIKSILYPRNKYLQKEIDEIVKKKRIIKESVDTINKIFLN